MKLEVTGVETVELTDPRGLCLGPIPQVGQPAIPGPNSILWPTGGIPATPQPQPMIPTPFAPPWRTTPFTGDPLPRTTSIWTKNLPLRAVPEHPVTHKEKWGVGIPEGMTAEPGKWERNWQSKMQQTLML